MLVFNPQKIKGNRKDCFPQPFHPTEIVEEKAASNEGICPTFLLRITAHGFNGLLTCFNAVAAAMTKSTWSGCCDLSFQMWISPQ